MPPPRLTASLAAALAFGSGSLLLREPAELWAALAPDATFLAQSGDLHAAHSASPRQTGISLTLGLELERAGQFAAAEAMLRTSARYDRQFLPAWTLANFYFRRDQPDEFWSWARIAAERNPGDFRPLLRLAEHATDRGPAQATGIIGKLGDRPELLRAYLDLLLADQRYPEARMVGERLAAARRPATLLPEDQLRLEVLRQKLSAAEPRGAPQHKAQPTLRHTLDGDTPSGKRDDR